MKNNSEYSSAACDWIDSLNASGPQAMDSKGVAKAGKKRGAAAKATAVNKEAKLKQSSGDGPKPKASPSKSAGGTTSGKAVYRSVQLREINSTRQMLPKHQPLITSLSNEEGLKTLSADKIMKAAAEIAKKTRPPTWRSWKPCDPTTLRMTTPRTQARRLRASFSSSAP